MRREEILAGLRAFTTRQALRARRALGAVRALAGPAAGERARAALRRLTGPGARERLRLGWAAIRRRPDAVLVAVLVAGVLVMILHWS